MFDYYKFLVFSTNQRYVSNEKAKVRRINFFSIIYMYLIYIFNIFNI